MYYQTKLKSVTAGGAIDVNGRRLSFVGNNPAQAGDTVWTDGRVIFGHIPIRGSVLNPPSESGIPIIANDINNDASNTHGYFNDKGTFKKYKIADDSWIVNNQKTFKHGGDAVIDAEITINNNAENSLRTAVFDRTNNEAIINENGAPIKKISLDKETERLINIKLKYDGDFELLKYTATHKLIAHEFPISNTANASVAMFDYGKPQFLEEKDFPFMDEQTGGDPYLNKALMALWEYCLFGSYNSETGEYSYSNRIDYVGIYAISFPNGSMAPVPITYLDPEINCNYVKVTSDAEQTFRNYKKVETSGYYSDKVDERDDLYNAIEHMKEVFEQYDAAGEYMHVTIQGTTEVVIGDSLIFPDTEGNFVARVVLSEDGTTIISASAKDLRNRDGSRRAPAIVMSYAVKKLLLYNTKDDTVQGRGYFFFEYTNSAGKYKWINALDPDKTTYRFLFSGGEMGDTNYGDGAVFLTRSGKYEASYEGDTHAGSVTETTTGDDDYDFPVQDDYYVNYEFQDSECQMTGIFDKEGNKICGRLPDQVDNLGNKIPAEAYNLSIAPINKNVYLVGVHEGKLYKLKDGELEEVGHDLKNFRLRKLKKISKAKKF